MSERDESARFEILEALIAEHAAQGRCATLEGWKHDIDRRLQPLLDGGGMREKRSAAKIQAAYESAALLVRTVAAERGA